MSARRAVVLMAALVLHPALGVHGSQLSTLEKLFPEAHSEWQVEVPVEGREPTFTLAAEHVVFLSDDGRLVEVRDRTGVLVKEIRLGQPLAGIDSSPARELILAVHVLDEDTYVHTMFDIEGRVLWKRTLGSAARLTPSGNYVVATYDVIDSSQPPLVLEATTGAVAWTDQANPVYWQLAASASDTLAYYRSEGVALVDLARGTTLWKRRLNGDVAHDSGNVLISLDGRVVAVRSRVHVETDERVVLRLFDRDGDRLWARSTAPVTGRTSGGELAGLSSDGSLLAIDDVRDFSILRTSDGRRVSVVRESSMCCVAAFTPTTLALSRGNRTRVLGLDAGGEVASDSTLDESLVFSFRPGGRPRDEARGGRGRYETVRARRAGPFLRLTGVDVDLGQGREE